MNSHLIYGMLGLNTGIKVTGRKCQEGDIRANRD